MKEVTTDMLEECNGDSKSHNALWLIQKANFQNTTCTLWTKTASLDTEDTENKVPECTELRNMKDLSHSPNQLSHLSINIMESLINLTHLDLSDIKIKSLPESLRILKKLQYLNLDINEFSRLPHVIGELINLRSLTARNNRIEEIHPNIGNLINLDNLDLSSNILKYVPFSCAKLYNVRTLFLTDNQLTKIPACVVNGMQNLEILDLSQNIALDLKDPPRSKNLNEFYASKNHVCPSFPKWVLTSIFCNLKILSFDETKFRIFEFPEKITSCSAIRIFSMKQSNLSNAIIEKIITRTMNLEKLLIGNDELRTTGNFFCFMPLKEIKQPLSVKEIDQRSTGLATVPSIIGNFSNLLKIDISENTISWLPEEICLLKNLESLLINNNTLVILPVNIGKLVSLKELKACHNNLSNLPDSIEDLNNLLFLDLYDNEFSCVPKEIMKLTNLLGLDLEQNYFVVDDLSIDRGMHYESMRANLREHWNEDYKTIDGPKSEPSLNESEIYPSSLSRKSSESSFGAYIQSDEMYNLDDLMNERWDISEDSADEFDPTECKVPRNYSPLETYQRQHVFCPADFHTLRIATRIKQMLQNGTLVWPTNFEDGQFDDP